MQRPGRNVNPVEMFRGAISFPGDFDVDWFCKVPSADAASARLDFLRTPSNIFELRRRGYAGAPLDRMWRSVYRACLSFDVPIPSELHHHAEELGVVVVE